MRNRPATSRVGNKVPWTGLVQRTKAVLKKLRVDQRGQPHQRVTHVHDLIEGRQQRFF
jgi:hypothetical protein